MSEVETLLKLAEQDVLTEFVAPAEGKVSKLWNLFESMNYEYYGVEEIEDGEVRIFSKVLKDRCITIKLVSDENKNVEFIAVKEEPRYYCADDNDNNDDDQKDDNDDKYYYSIDELIKWLEDNKVWYFKAVIPCKFESKFLNILKREGFQPQSTIVGRKFVKPIKKSECAIITYIGCECSNNMHITGEIDYVC